MNLSPVCISCRTWTDERIDLRTVERRGEVLVCECGRRYPVVDGVPIMLAEPAEFLRAEMATVVEREMAPEVQALLVEGGPDDAIYPRLVEHLSIYLDAHWGDRAAPPPDGVRFGLEALVARIAARSGERVKLAVELGCSVGRVVAELAQGADEVMGVDLQFGSVRRARRILDGERVTYNRRVVGRHYTPASVQAGDRAVSGGRVQLICANAIDPPLVPGAFGRVVALNLVDSVSRPRQLLSVMDGLCARGGELILSSPYAWQSSVMDEDERLGGADPAAALTAILRNGDGLGARYEIEDEAEVAWSLRRDARSVVAYRTHYLRARKL
jgi:uncharacterized protein YbaR (Trm112 family)/SAM-dependent methyltransferase